MFNLLKFKETKNLTTTTADAIPEGTTLEQCKDEMLGLMRQENTNHHRMGLIYNYIVENKLAEKAGFKDAKDFVAKQLADLSQSTLSTYGAVADAFTEPVARRFGVTCLYLLLTYKEATDIDVDHEEPGDTLIEVPDDEGVVTALPFKSCSVDQMRNALKRKRKPASTKPLPPEAETLAGQFRDAVSTRFPKGKGALVKVSVRNQKGKAVLDFKGVPLEQVDQLIEALTSQVSSLRRLQ